MKYENKNLSIDAEKIDLNSNNLRLTFPLKSISSKIINLNKIKKKSSHTTSIKKCVGSGASIDSSIKNKNSAELQGYKSLKPPIPVNNTVNNIISILKNKENKDNKENSTPFEKKSQKLILNTDSNNKEIEIDNHNNDSILKLLSKKKTEKNKNYFLTSSSIEFDPKKLKTSPLKNNLAIKRQKTEKSESLTNSFIKEKKNKSVHIKRLNTEDDVRSSFRCSEKNSLLILEEESPIKLLTPNKILYHPQTPKALNNLDLSFLKNNKLPKECTEVLSDHRLITDHTSQISKASTNCNFKRNYSRSREKSYSPSTDCHNASNISGLSKSKSNLEGLKTIKRWESPTKIRYESSVGGSPTNGSICYLNTEPNVPYPVSRNSNPKLTTSESNSINKKDNYVSPFNQKSQPKIINISQVSSDQIYNTDYKSNNFKYNRFSEKMPKLASSLTSKLLKSKTLFKNENLESLETKITEKYLNTNNEDKKQINDFNSFKKSELNKIMKFNAERIFQIDEKPRNFLKAKSLVMNQRIESAEYNISNVNYDVNINKFSNNKIENTEHSNYIDRVKNSSKHKLEDLILTEIKNSFNNCNNSNSNYNNNNSISNSISNSNVNKTVSFIKNNNIDYESKQLSTSPSPDKSDRIERQDKSDLLIKKFESSISAFKDDKEINNFSIGVKEKLSETIKSQTTNTITPVKSLNSNNSNSNSNINKFIQSKAYEKFPIKVKTNNI